MNKAALRVAASTKIGGRAVRSALYGGCADIGADFGRKEPFQSQA
jgi:hypothetical protein